MAIHPSPGILLIEPLDTKTNAILTGNKQFQRNKKGKIIAKGKNLVTDFGALIEIDWYGKVGDIVYFLSYEEGYDQIDENGKKYYLVKYQDLRGIVE